MPKSCVKYFNVKATKYFDKDIIKKEIYRIPASVKKEEVVIEAVETKEEAPTSEETESPPL